MKELEAYLNNTLTSTEKEAFENRMQHDSRLQEAVQSALKELLRNYFAQELPESENESIEQRVKQEVVFQKAYQAEAQLENNADTLSEMQHWLENYENVKNIFEKNRDELLAIYSPSAQVLDMRTKLPQSNEGSENEAKVKSVRWLKPILYAAAACVVLLFVLNIGRNSYSSSSLAQKYFSGTGTPDAGITLGADRYEEGLEAFDQENYPKAIELLTQIPDTSSKYSLSRYLIGYAYLQSEEIESAITTYEYIMEAGSNATSPFFPYIERSRWFLSLAYLEKGEENKAKTLLQKIADDKDHYKHTSAVELLGDLNHFLH